MLTEVYLDFPQTPQTSYTIVPVNRQRPHPSTFFSIHYLSVILLLGSIQTVADSVIKQAINQYLKYINFRKN
jgi:hypothetical protein